MLSTNWAEIGQTKVERKPPDHVAWSGKSITNSEL